MKILFASCLLLLCSTIQANTVVHSVFRSGYATEDVVLDTNPGSAFWQGAPSHAPGNHRTA